MYEHLFTCNNFFSFILPLILINVLENHIKYGILQLMMYFWVFSDKTTALHTRLPDNQEKFIDHPLPDADTNEKRRFFHGRFDQDR